MRANRGGPGIDGLSVEQFPSWWAKCRQQVIEELRSGRYRPQPVKRCEIPKLNGGVRVLGVPTVLDRVVQQAIVQVLTPLFDPGFSAHSYGFRPGRSAHDAVRQAREHVADGFRWVVDLDLESFFDRVNRDVLMGRLARCIADRALLRLIRRFLQAGMMSGGVVSPRVAGTPQGGPRAVERSTRSGIYRLAAAQGFERYQAITIVYAARGSAASIPTLWSEHALSSHRHGCRDGSRHRNGRRSGQLRGGDPLGSESPDRCHVGHAA